MNGNSTARNMRWAWILVVLAIVLAAVFVARVAGDNPRNALGELVRGTPLDAPFHTLIGDVRSRLRPARERCTSNGAAANPVDIVLIAVDTLRADHLGFQGYARPVSPNLDALARDSIVFRNAISAAPWTTPAFVGVFTGSHPGALGFEGDPLLLPAQVPVLAQLLCEAGWQTAGVVSHSYVGVKYGFDRGFESWDERNAGGHTYVSSPHVTETAIAYLDEFANDTRPFFLFAHYFDPHFDYREHEAYRFSEGEPGSFRSEADNINELIKLASAGKLDDASVRSIVDSYDSEIAYTDANIGLLLDSLKARGLYRDSLIVFLGDHGEMLVERPQRLLGHGMAVYQALVHVPLLIKLPELRRVGRVDPPVSTVDLLPTVLDVIDYADPPPSAARERSLLDVRADFASPVFSQTRRDGFRDTVLEGPWKLIRDTQVNTTELYDLSRDPDETEDVASRHPQVVARLEALLEAWHRDLEAKRQGMPTGVSPTLTPEETEQLRGLGYVE